MATPAMSCPTNFPVSKVMAWLYQPCSAPLPGAPAYWSLECQDVVQELRKTLDGFMHTEAAQQTQIATLTLQALALPDTPTLRVFEDVQVTANNEYFRLSMAHLEAIYPSAIRGIKTV